MVTVTVLLRPWKNGVPLGTVVPVMWTEKLAPAAMVVEPV